MQQQCPACHSFCESTASFCGQCGARLGRGGERRVKGPWVWFAGLLVVLIGVVLFLLQGTDAPGTTSRSRAVPGGGIARVTTARPSRDDGGASASVARPLEYVIEAEDDEPPTEAELAERAEVVLVVLEILGEDDRPLADCRGVLVAEDGVVLTRLSSLLGAQRATCRLGGLRQARLPVLGVTEYDARSDLALVRVETAGGSVIAMPVLADPPERVFQAGDPVFVFSGLHLRPARVGEPYWAADDGRDGMRLAPEPRVVPETFLAVDSFGSLIGLCRPVQGGRVLPARARVSPLEPGYRVLVEPAFRLAERVDSPVRWTLSQLTNELYTGTFEDRIARGTQAFRDQNWAAAAEFFLQALQRVNFEDVPEEAVERASRDLRESYLRQIAALRGAHRHLDAIESILDAIEMYPRDVTFWIALGETRQTLSHYRDAVDAFLQVVALEPSDRSRAALESAYLEFAARTLAGGDERTTEAIYIEGLAQLPRSGRMHLELARLYHAWEAYDDAIRLYRVAADLDPRLGSQVDVYLDRIEDVLRRRNAVVLPIAPGDRLIHANIVVDGRTEVPVIVDTGATHTTINRRVAEALGYVVDRGERIRLRTAGGQIEARMIRLAEVDLSGYTLRDVEAIVLPDSIGLETGLLGQNFLRHFKYSVDASRGEFRLERQ